jgi:hypothetical protein
MWARGLARYDATLTRWRSPVRIRAGPLYVLSGVSMDPYLSVLNGVSLGKVIDDIGVNKLAVVSSDENLVLASSILSSFLTISNGVGRLFLDTELQGVVDFDPQLLLLLVEGEKLPTVADFLHRKGLSADILLPFELTDFLDNHPFWKKRDVFAYLFDPEKGKLFLGKVFNASSKCLISTGPTSSFSLSFIIAASRHTASMSAPV